MGPDHDASGQRIDSVCRITSGLPAWAPQQMLAEVTSSSRAWSLGNPSPRSAFRSMRPGCKPSVRYERRSCLLASNSETEIGSNRIRSPARIGKYPSSRIGDAKRGRSEQMPAPGRVDGIDGRLPAHDGYRARRHRSAAASGDGAGRPGQEEAQPA